MDSVQLAAIQNSLQDFLKIHNRHYIGRSVLAIAIGFYSYLTDGNYVGFQWAFLVVVGELLGKQWRNYLAQKDWSAGNLRSLILRKDLVTTALAFIWVLGPISHTYYLPDEWPASLIWTGAILLVVSWHQTSVWHSYVLPSIPPFVTIIAIAGVSSPPEYRDTMIFTVCLFLINTFAIAAHNFRNNRLRYQNQAGLTQALLDLNKAHEKVVQSKLAVEQASETKSAFFSVMGHEIRTPLNGIIAMSDLMQNADDQQDMQEYARTIHGSGNMLLTILNDMLDISKMEAGQMTIEEQPFSATGLLESVRNLWDVTAREKGLQLSVRKDGDLPDRLMGDEFRLKQVLFNLIGNAIKYTEAGTIDLQMQYAPNDQNRYLVSVTDTGPGIPQEAFETLFDPYTQAEETSRRKLGGTGLGLSVVKQLTTLMGGDVHVQSELGKGSVFTVVLPLKDVEPAPPPSPTPAAAPSANNHSEEVVNLLIVDDVEMNRKVAEALLGGSGFNIAFARGGSDVIPLLESHPTSLIVMDINMPGMSGVEATRQIRSSNMPWANIPILGLTAEKEGPHWQEYYNAGMNRVISKPIMRDMFIRTIEEVLVEAR